MIKDNIIFYEDHARINITDNAKRNSITQSLLALECFEEVVSGITEICVKFDPSQFSEDDIQKLLLDHETNMSHIQTKTRQHILTANFDNAPDIDRIAAMMKMDKPSFIHWFLAQDFYVEMMGFQPGFAYLSHHGNAPTLDRLTTPRSKVSSGSIGFLGKSACIYAHDGPGGWPIIGKIKDKVFDIDNDPPNLLQSGDGINFK